MKKTTLLFLFFFIFLFAVSAQQKKVQNAYVDYFELPRESLFLHTNKTLYMSGEEIWFTAYAFDRRSNLSSKATTNIYVDLYDNTGKQIDKKLFLAKDGIASGNFSIDPMLNSGDYYLKTYTNWMKNFVEDDSFIQKITVIKPGSIVDNKEEISKVEYDIQFLPEGGHLVSDVKNNIGIKALDDTGKGTKVEGVVTNSKGLEITSF